MTWQYRQRSGRLSAQLGQQTWEELSDDEDEVYVRSIVKSLQESMKLANDIMEGPQLQTLEVNPRWPCNHLAHILQDFLHKWAAFSNSCSMSTLAERVLQARKLQEKVLEIESLLALSLRDQEVPKQYRLLTRVSLLVNDLVQTSYQAAVGCHEE